ncbi:conserved Plasmodium protein, unknown function [Plasmodium ovale]|nr:conserved Plasmodium protein, unknown function [Plasmodium ovale]
MSNIDSAIPNEENGVIFNMSDIRYSAKKYNWLEKSEKENNYIFSKDNVNINILGLKGLVTVEIKLPSGFYYKMCRSNLRKDEINDLFTYTNYNCTNDFLNKTILCNNYNLSVKEKINLFNKNDKSFFKNIKCNDFSIDINREKGKDLLNVNTEMNTKIKNHITTHGKNENSDIVDEKTCTFEIDKVEPHSKSKHAKYMYSDKNIVHIVTTSSSTTNAPHNSDTVMSDRKEHNKNVLLKDEVNFNKKKKNVQLKREGIEDKLKGGCFFNLEKSALMSMVPISDSISADFGQSPGEQYTEEGLLQMWGTASLGGKTEQMWDAKDQKGNSTEQVGEQFARPVHINHTKEILTNGNFFNSHNLQLCSGRGDKICEKYQRRKGEHKPITSPINNNHCGENGLHNSNNWIMPRISSFHNINKVKNAITQGSVAGCNVKRDGAFNTFICEKSYNQPCFLSEDTNNNCDACSELLCRENMNMAELSLHRNLNRGNSVNYNDTIEVNNNRSDNNYLLSYDKGYDVNLGTYNNGDCSIGSEEGTPYNIVHSPYDEMIMYQIDNSGMSISSDVEIYPYEDTSNICSWNKNCFHPLNTANQVITHNGYTKNNAVSDYNVNCNNNMYVEANMEKYMYGTKFPMYRHTYEEKKNLMNDMYQYQNRINRKNNYDKEFENNFFYEKQNLNVNNYYFTYEKREKYIYEQMPQNRSYWHNLGGREMGYFNVSNRIHNNFHDVVVDSKANRKCFQKYGKNNDTVSHYHKKGNKKKRNKNDTYSNRRNDNDCSSSCVLGHKGYISDEHNMGTFDEYSEPCEQSESNKLPHINKIRKSTKINDTLERSEFHENIKTNRIKELEEEICIKLSYLMRFRHDPANAVPRHYCSLKHLLCANNRKKLHMWLKNMLTDNKCGYCNEQFDNLDELENHFIQIKTHSIFYCCEKPFPSLKYLCKHFKRKKHHGYIYYY